MLTSGGVSTGEEDHVKAALSDNGSLVFWRLAIKPGRPVAMGIIEGTPFVGLPGNPVAVFITFVASRAALDRRALGATFEPARLLPVTSGFAYKKKKGRREYVRVSLRDRCAGDVGRGKISGRGRGRPDVAHPHPRPRRVARGRHLV